MIGVVQCLYILVYDSSLANSSLKSANSNKAFPEMEVSLELVSLFVFVSTGVVVGGIGNGLILWIYSRNKQLPVRTFILILAALDFYASVLYMPLMLVVHADVVNVYVIVPQAVFIGISYDSCSIP